MTIGDVGGDLGDGSIWNTLQLKLSTLVALGRSLAAVLGRWVGKPRKIAVVMNLGVHTTAVGAYPIGDAICSGGAVLGRVC